MKKDNVLGKWAFIIGLIVVLVASFWTTYATIMLAVLFILGLVVGFMNIAEKNNIKFLVSVVTLLLLGIASINVLSFLGIISSYLNSILGNFITFVSAAGLVVAIKSVLETSQK